MADTRFTYQLPRMHEVSLTRDIVYTSPDGSDLHLDIYRPPASDPGIPLPAVVFVHGGGDPPEGLAGYKDHAQYQMWGRLVAASGLIGVTFNHRTREVRAAADDVSAAVAFIRERADDVGIDRDRLAIWSCSAGGYLGLLTVLKDAPDCLRCAVCYYGIIDLELFIQRAGRAAPTDVEQFNPLRYVRDDPGSRIPLQIVRVGEDYPEINASIDSFVHAALAHNLDFELVNYAAGEHAFDCFDDSATSQRIIQGTLDFLAHHLVLPGC